MCVFVLACVNLCWPARAWRVCVHVVFVFVRELTCACWPGHAWACPVSAAGPPAAVGPSPSAWAPRSAAPLHRERGKIQVSVKDYAY